MITITVPRYGQPRFRVRDEQEVPTAAHVILYTPKHEVLVMRRTGADYWGHWGLPGGGIDPGESPLVGLLREVKEEVGVDLKLIPNAVNRMTPGMVSGGSQCFSLGVHQFRPTLNDEHDSFTWARPDNLPRPMHPNARAVINHFFQNLRGFNHG